MKILTRPARAIRVSAELPTILEGAGAEYDLVILDSPPLSGFPKGDISIWR